MDEKKLVKFMMELHEFLEDKEIYYPENVHLIECYLSWVRLSVEELRLKE